MTLESTITYPSCSHQASETMSTNACQHFYDCKGCGEVLKPLPGDCCVFCSYGSVPCPPIQESGGAVCPLSWHLGSNYVLPNARSRAGRLDSR